MIAMEVLRGQLAQLKEGTCRKGIRCTGSLST